ncbi:hypothetical protein [Methylobacterium sp. J-070]|uniref:hypothetical protein n=1 Tax=Methylobacterium sp. J-070 TaxID=2836650 RepID=UPI001FB9BC1C|nr:hypothetical protein [Methylobacterium sp. J-070]MCJ2049658.1 hypothetical protein [Methylobacterium sp. J-070]
MPSLKLSNPFRRSADRPSLKQRAADLKAGLSQHVSRPQTVPELGTTPAEAGADAELLRLGAQFAVARAREIAACEACNEAQREADRHMPERPACLIYRASDARLNVHQNWMMADALEGREVHHQDVARLRRIMPMTHEVLRPIRKGERAHRDHLGHQFDIVPHPDAQARAEEIVTAWDAWRAEQARVQDQYLTPELERAAETAGEDAANLAELIACCSAHTADGFRVKLRALSHYRRDTLLAEITDSPDPDQLLSHSLWRDVQGEMPAPSPADTLTTAILDLWPIWACGPQDDGGTAEEVAAYEELQQRRFALIDAVEALPATLQNIAPKALALAWLEYVDLWRAGYGRSFYATDGRLALDIHAAAAARTPTAAPAALREPSLVGMLDLASASLEDLQSLHDVADLVGGVAYAMCWQARCRIHGPSEGYNAAGKLMQWLGDALTDVETAANKEARRRRPANSADRETRLEMLALPVIQNGDPDEAEAFARELSAHAEAERQGL